MNTSPLIKVMESLIEIKSVMHDETNAGTTEMLDEVISFIQQCIDNDCDDKDHHMAVLIMIGKVFDKLPSIAALIKYISD